jgi:hypothetical protein
MRASKRKSIPENRELQSAVDFHVSAGLEPATEADSEPSRVKVMLNLSAETARRLRSAVYWTPGGRLSKMADQALSEYVDRLEAERGGKPFPQIEGRLEGGRPVA